MGTITWEHILFSLIFGVISFGSIILLGVIIGDGMLAGIIVVVVEALILLLLLMNDE